jgi:hypothetical protein
MDVPVTPVHEEYAARLGFAAMQSDAAAIDGILDEIADAGLAYALAVVAVQTRNLVWTLRLHQGDEVARSLFERTIIDAGQACDGAS